MGKIMHPSPYGDDQTVKAFLDSLDLRPKRALAIWQLTLRRAVLINAVKPTSVVERLEHGDCLDSIEATLQRMWQAVWDRYHWDLDASQSICEVYDGILVQCGRYFLSSHLPDHRQEKWRSFLSGILGGDAILDEAILLAKANA